MLRYRGLVYSLALATSGCTSAIATVGEVSVVDDVRRIVPYALDERPISAERILIVRADATRIEARGQLLRRDDALVIRDGPTPEMIVPIALIDAVELRGRRDVHDVLEAEAVSYASGITAALLLGLPLLLLFAAAE